MTTIGTRNRAQNAFNRSSSGIPNGRRTMGYGDIIGRFDNCTEAPTTRARKST
ncbi:hypothetical protein ACGF12_33305 [Kitasatospora sp. NPDC048296]|jgi:hypothetical protein|uniref:hypothetical protein n=1 Tax=Kitasatospora sp. NPDC048296 TaxID=3364048 RepID=UPI0037241EC0